ncbi:MAG: hypothetical protein LBG80_16225 [Bacteroidales bacterium]|jgi:hypothetical protein|nr:hypothetical protein [Bacteroidales bacterium]
MNFSEIENIEKQVVAAEYEERNYYLPMFEEYIAREHRKEQSKENPFVYFYSDVIADEIAYDFQPILGDKAYKNASEDAQSCLSICDELLKLSSYSATGWLQNALKFADNIVLHYIQDVCKETPKKYDNAGIEKSRYIQLCEKSGDISVAGANLKELYELRNKFEHRTKTNSDGTQELIRPQKNKARYTIVKLYPIALKKILQTYKSIL